MPAGRLLVPLLAIWLGACAAATPEPAPPPLRPEAEPAASREGEPARADCRPWTAADQGPSWTYQERVLPQAENLAQEGVRLLREAEDSSMPRPRREDLIVEAVDKLVLALKSDPYNVHATYNLAAAYARVGRRQCSLNLLERLVTLRKLPSQQAAVDAKADRLLGRGRFKNNMDPDFYGLRGDRDFLEVVNQL